MSQLLNFYFNTHNTYTQKYDQDSVVVLMQVGSFYEIYASYHDGCNIFKISSLLNIKIGKKSQDKISRNNPYMIGFPLDSLDKYLRVLLNNNFIIPLIQQTSDPPNPNREITKVFSKTTYIDDTISSSSNIMMSIYIEESLDFDDSLIVYSGLSMVDLSTGVSYIYEINSFDSDSLLPFDNIVRFIQAYSPSEIIIYRHSIKKHLENSDLLNYLEVENRNYRFFDSIDKKYSNVIFQMEFLDRCYSYNTDIFSNSLEYLNILHIPFGTISFVLLLNNAYQYDDKIINNLNIPILLSDDESLILANNALYQLNVFKNTSIDSGNSKFKSLFDVVNNTSTAFGKRYLQERIIRPTSNKDSLINDYNNIEQFIPLQKELHSKMSGILDIERLYRRLMLNKIHPFELLNLIDSLKQICIVNEFLKDNNLFNYDFSNLYILTEFFDNMFNQNIKEQKLDNITEMIFNKEIYPDLDILYNDINSNIDIFESIRIKLSNILDYSDNSIKLKYTKSGYYFETTNLRAETLQQNIPNEIQINHSFSIKKDDLIFIPKKSNTKIEYSKFSDLTNLLNSQRELFYDNLNDLFTQNIDIIKSTYSNDIKSCIQQFSYIDFLKSAARTAVKHNHFKPSIQESDSSFINCSSLRHPIIELISNNEYIPHDISIGKDLKGMLIYGLNSSGKSSLMKAIGLSIIMAQSGMFVPAESFEFKPYRQLMTRITGNDNIFKGLSSFALEMTELKAIIKRSDSDTMVIGDEVCRGTEHISGNSIVASTLVRLAENNSSFIFATHLHEIASLQIIQNIPTIKSFHLTVEEQNGKLIFDRILKEGSGETIYGITVAQHIIDDIHFISIANQVKNTLLNKPNEILTNKKSKYNSNVFVDRCSICGTNDVNESYETHHIIHQKNFRNETNPKHIKMNQHSNLQVLCSKCHDDIHSSS